MECFNLRTKIYFGEGALERIREFKNKKIFIVTDPFMIKSGAINKITEEVSKGNNEYFIFSEVVPDPTIELVVEGVNNLIDFNPDMVIAIGGGSAIDAAKAICSFKNSIENKLYKKGIGKKPYFIAVPTTSGTGSEVTSFSVITDKQNNVKYPLVSDELLPDEAILEAELVKTVPNFITADTGMDVLTHALEAYVSRAASDYTDALAEKVIRLVFENLPKVYKNGNNMESRRKMHNASCIAGIAFNTAFLGLNHGMAHIIGGRFHIPHGRANSILLPYIIEYNADIKDFNSFKANHASQKYAEVARLLGLPCSTARQGVKSLITAIKKLQKELNMPITFKQTGIDEAEFYKELSDIAMIAIQDRCTATNPREPKKEEVELLFNKAYKGI